MYLILFLISIFFPPKVHAASEFDLHYNTLYTAAQSGVVEVSHVISLTNKTSQIYATSFSYEVGLTNLTDIKIKDAVSELVPQIDKSQNSTKLFFNFADQVAGKGKTNTFTISYKTTDILTRNGAVWELNIPKIESEHSSATYKTSISLPSTFPQAAYIDPEPISTSPYLTFPEFSSFQPSITAVFGTTQYLEFELDYHLDNPQGQQANTVIAIPPDTQHQTIYLKSIDPLPENITVDKDGNWLATFLVPQKTNLDVVVKGIVKIDFTPKQLPLLEEDLPLYLSSSALWQTDSQEIVTLGKNLKSPKNIFDYVVDHLVYNYDRINATPERFGALKTLDNPTYAICTDFADLFVTLSRAAGIPARELEGYAFTQNDKLRPLALSQDILHAWAEYYDFNKMTWVQVDPTWTNTTGGIDYFNKLDLNHFVFVIHGLDPQKPSPAGAYKNPKVPSKDVKVSATTSVPPMEPNLEYEILDSTPQKPTLRVKNIGSVSYKGQIHAYTDNKDIDQTQVIDTLPPFAYIDLPLTPKSLFTPTSITAILSIEDGNKTNTLTITYKGAYSPSLTMAFYSGLFLFLTTAILAWRLRFFRSKRPLPLHW